MADGPDAATNPPSPTQSAGSPPRPGDDPANAHRRHHHRKGAIAVVVVLVVVLGAAFGARWVQPPEPGAFYDPPSPLPSGDPGTILRVEEFTPSLSNARAWRVLYLSTDPQDRPIAVSGTVVAPADATAGEDRPVVAWAHGTSGVAERCAPSLFGDGTANIPGLADMIANGWIVAATDYPGLGTRGPHPYLVGQSEARAVLDSVRAARLLDVGAGTTFATWGHSQGGHASLWSAQFAGDHAPELTLVGTSSAAPAIELGRLLEADEGTLAGNVLMSFALVSWDAYYPDTPMDEITTSAGAHLAKRVARRCIESNAQVLAIAADAVAQKASFLTADPVSTSPWSTYIAANVPNDPIAVPIFVAQGTADEIVRPFTTKDALTARCNAGETVQLKWFDGLSHVEVADASAPDAVVWMRDRFEGGDAPQNCDVVRNDPVPDPSG